MYGEQCLAPGKHSVITKCYYEVIPQVPTLQWPPPTAPQGPSKFLTGMPRFFKIELWHPSHQVILSPNLTQNFVSLTSQTFIPLTRTYLSLCL